MLSTSPSLMPNNTKMLGQGLCHFGNKTVTKITNKLVTNKKGELP